MAKFCLFETERVVKDVKNPQSDKFTYSLCYIRDPEDSLFVRLYRYLDLKLIGIHDVSQLQRVSSFCLDNLSVTKCSGTTS